MLHDKAAGAVERKQATVLLRALILDRASLACCMCPTSVVGRVMHDTSSMHVVHARTLAAGAALLPGSRYGAPWMEGSWSEVPEEDCSTDPVGNVAAVQTLAKVFRGLNVRAITREDGSTVLDPEATSSLEFSVQEISIFSTVVRHRNDIAAAPAGVRRMMVTSHDTNQPDCTSLRLPA